MPLQIARGDKAWKAWFDTEAPEENPIPDGYTTLDTFRKLLLIRYNEATMKERRERERERDF